MGLTSEESGGVDQDEDKEIQLEWGRGTFGELKQDVLLFATGFIPMVFRPLHYLMSRLN